MSTLNNYWQNEKNSASLPSYEQAQDQRSNSIPLRALRSSSASANRASWDANEDGLGHSMNQVLEEEQRGRSRNPRPFSATSYPARSNTVPPALPSPNMRGGGSSGNVTPGNDLNMDFHKPMYARLRRWFFAIVSVMTVLLITAIVLAVVFALKAEHPNCDLPGRRVFTTMTSTATYSTTYSTTSVIPPITTHATKTVASIATQTHTIMPNPTTFVLNCKTLWEHICTGVDTVPVDQTTGMFGQCSYMFMQFGCGLSTDICGGFKDFCGIQ